MRTIGVVAVAAVLVIGLSAGCGSGQPAAVAETPMPTPTPTVDRSLVEIVWQNTDSVVCGTTTKSICIGDYCESKEVDVRCAFWQAEVQSESAESITVTIRLNWNDSHGKTLSSDRLTYLLEPGVTELDSTFYGEVDDHGEFIDPELVVSGVASLAW